MVRSSSVKVTLFVAIPTPYYHTSLRIGFQTVDIPEAYAGIFSLVSARREFFGRVCFGLFPFGWCRALIKELTTSAKRRQEWRRGTHELSACATVLASDSQEIERTRR